jgi:hypothetical protein
VHSIQKTTPDVNLIQDLKGLIEQERKIVSTLSTHLLPRHWMALNCRDTVATIGSMQLKNILPTVSANLAKA